MALDLKYYNETTISAAKGLNNNIVKDYYFLEKYETLKLLDSKFKSRKIYHSKAFNSFIVIFNTDKDEGDVFNYLAKLKKGYSGIQLILDIEYDKEQDILNYILKIEYKNEVSLH